MHERSEKILEVKSLTQQSFWRETIKNTTILSKGDEDLANENYKSYDELPLMLDAKTVKDIMGVSIGLVYELMTSDRFPSVRIGNRYIVPKEKFIDWIEKPSGT